MPIPPPRPIAPNAEIAADAVIVVKEPIVAMTVVPSIAPAFISTFEITTEPVPSGVKFSLAPSVIVIELIALLPVFNVVDHH